MHTIYAYTHVYTHTHEYTPKTFICSLIMGNPKWVKLMRHFHYGAPGSSGVASVRKTQIKTQKMTAIECAFPAVPRCVSRVTFMLAPAFCCLTAQIALVKFCLACQIVSSAFGKKKLRACRACRPTCVGAGFLPYFIFWHFTNCCDCRNDRDAPICHPSVMMESGRNSTKNDTLSSNDVADGEGYLPVKKVPSTSFN